jgi:LmbE family N-acetylglucosaminyl deacetylase
MRGFRLRDFAESFGDGPVLVLAPHPDDESLGCGGLIAEACRQGIPPIVAILTDGSMSHPNSPSYPAERLRALRERETRSAMDALLLPQDRLEFLRYTDTHAPRDGAALLAAAGRIAALVRQAACCTVAVTWRHDPHCDHAAAAAIAEAVCRITQARLVFYPIWGWTLPPDTELGEESLRGFQLDISRHLPAKRAAIAAHRSQYGGIITDDPGAFQMPQDFIERFLGPTEVFLDIGVPA